MVAFAGLEVATVTSYAAEKTMNRPQLQLQCFEANRALPERLASIVQLCLCCLPDVLVILRGADASYLAALIGVFWRHGWDTSQLDQRVIPVRKPVELRRLAFAICGASINSAASTEGDGCGGDRATALLAVAAERIRRIHAQWAGGVLGYARDERGRVNDPLLAVVARELFDISSAWDRVCTEFAHALGSDVDMGCEHFMCMLGPDLNLHKCVV
jgi:hypothetical protein